MLLRERAFNSRFISLYSFNIIIPLLIAPTRPSFVPRSQTNPTGFVLASATGVVLRTYSELKFANVCLLPMHCISW